MISRKNFIKAGDVDRLFGVLNQKQVILARVARIEQQLEPFKNNWSVIRSRLDDDDRQVIDVALGSVEDLLAELIREERISETLLVEEKSRLEEELARIADSQELGELYRESTSESNVSTLGMFEQLESLS